jgi:hypothetical protein
LKKGITKVNDQFALRKFLDFLSKDISESRLEGALPAEVTAFALTRDLSKIDENENIEGNVDI